MREFGRSNFVVSKCLGFAACRWNGMTIPVEFIKKLEPFVDFYPVCPEVEIGLGFPRDPIRIVSMKGEKKLVQPATGEDVSEKMLSFADRFLSSLVKVDGFILKNRALSCGIKDVRVYPSMERRVAALTSKSAGFLGGRFLIFFRIWRLRMRGV